MLQCKLWMQKIGLSCPIICGCSHGQSCLNTTIEDSTVHSSDIITLYMMKPIMQKLKNITTEFKYMTLTFKLHVNRITDKRINRFYTLHNCIRNIKSIQISDVRISSICSVLLYQLLLNENNTHQKWETRHALSSKEPNTKAHPQRTNWHIYSLWIISSEIKCTLSIQIQEMKKCVLLFSTTWFTIIRLQADTSRFHIVRSKL